MLLAAIWDDLFTHTQAHTTVMHRYSSSPSPLFSILPLCKCVFCSSSATRSFIHEPEMETRWANLFTANLDSPRCVVFVRACTHRNNFCQDYLNTILSILICILGKCAVIFFFHLFAYLEVFLFYSWKNDVQTDLTGQINVVGCSALINYLKICLVIICSFYLWQYF